jgi:hypothetical protein
MNIEELKTKLAEMDAEIKNLRVAKLNAESDLQVAVLKRANYARINCDHPQDQRYERSVMGREIDIHCGVCGIEI